MRPVPIPDDEVWEGCLHKVVGPPPGLGLGIEGVDALIEWVEPAGIVFRIRCVIEEADVERIKAGERVFWLSWWGDHLHPFSVGMPDDNQTEDP